MAKINSIYAIYFISNCVHVISIIYIINQNDMHLYVYKT
jgi:hypothetical protein